MDRRSWILASAVGIAAATRHVHAQGDGRKIRLGWVTAQTAPSLTPYVAALRAALSDLGYVEGRNLDIVFRYGDDDIRRVPDMAVELDRLPVDVLLAQGAAVPVIAGLSLKTPVAYVFSGDPVVAGLASSLSKPRGNMTGLTFMAAELNAKRMEILRDIVPGMRRVALLANPEHPGAEIERSNAEEAARRLNIDVEYRATRSRAELEQAMAAMSASRPHGISLFSDGFAIANRQSIMAFSDSLGVPVIAAWPVFAQAGAICSYGPRLSDSYRRLAGFVDRLVKGARPADLPIERPTTFELVVNQKAARKLNVPIPASLLAKADDVIS